MHNDAQQPNISKMAGLASANPNMPNLNATTAISSWLKQYTTKETELYTIQRTQ
jgi:hypothetical protein